MTYTDLEQYLLHLADNALIIGHRNSEWTGHGPILEQDIALSNISLDLIGQARNFYQYAAKLVSDRGYPATEDTLAYHRDAIEYRNNLLCELPNGDWGRTILRQFFFSAYQYYLFQELLKSPDKQLSAIAEKSLKETIYHLRWSSEWTIRLGDGTEESNSRMQGALNYLMEYTPELFESGPSEKSLVSSGIIPSPGDIKSNWEKKVREVLLEAALIGSESEFQMPQTNKGSGKLGFHTEHLGFLLAEMQFLQRAYPGNEW